jgi:hypothetical protein
MDLSYSKYLEATKLFGVTSVSEREYVLTLQSAAQALQDSKSLGGVPYVILHVGDIYVKVMKVEENLNISFMDSLSFKILTGLASQKGGNYFTQS